MKLHKITKGPIRPRSKQRHPESELQRECFKWAMQMYPELKYLLFAIPNGGKRSKIEAAIMQGEGVTAGVADMFLAKTKNSYNTVEKSYFGLFIEFKHGKGKQTPNQLAFEYKVIFQGYKYVVVRTFEQFKTIINEYLN